MRRSIVFMLILISAAPGLAQTLQAPEIVTAHADGSFDFVVEIVGTEQGSVVGNIRWWVDEGITPPEFSQDCFCDWDLCRVTLEKPLQVEVNGGLTNPFQVASLTFRVGFCGGPMLTREIRVQPLNTVATGEASWSTLKSRFR